MKLYIGQQMALPALGSVRLGKTRSEAAATLTATVLTAPADSTPQGVWKIDENGELVHKDGVAIKSARFTSIRQLIGEGSAYADAFAGGTLTHTFLDVNDYHRYHFPIDGTVLEGGLQPSSEWRMHAAIYEKKPGVSAVFHTHSPYATAFAVNRQTIPAVLIEAFAFLGGDIRCADYATPGTREVGLNALPALEGRMGCTLANHGVLAVGKDLQQAYLNAEYVEDVARIYSLARAVGTPVPLEKL